MGTLVTVAATLAAGYLLGRLRPWRRAGDWAADQVRFTGAWVRGGVGRQAVVVLVHVVTAPRTSWRTMRAPATETRASAPVRDPDWVANRTRTQGRHSVSTEQHDAYGQELARISQHQSAATNARFTVFQALAAVGIANEQADEIVSKLEAGAVAGAHTWISESNAPHGSEQRFKDGWFAGVRDVASYLLRIADTTATAQRGRAASSALLLAHLRQPASSTPAPPAQEPGPAAALDAKEVMAAAQRCTWALADPGDFLVPEASDEILTVALSAVREDERAGYAQRLEEFAEQHRERLEELLRAYGPGSTPASHGRYMLAGQPESLIVCERMEAAPFLLRSRWDKALEAALLDDLEFAWGPRTRLSR